MKIKDGFILQKFTGKYIAVSANDEADVSNILITLNSTGAFVWELLKTETEYDAVISKLVEKYDVDETEAKTDFNAFLKKAV